VESGYHRSSWSVSLTKYSSDFNIHSTRNMFISLLDLLHSRGPGWAGEVNSSWTPLRPRF
jgi:hypothetical protein